MTTKTTVRIGEDFELECYQVASVHGSLCDSCQLDECPYRSTKSFFQDQYKSVLVKRCDAGEEMGL